MTIRVVDRVTGGIIAALAIGLIAVLAGGISAGPLDPSGPPGSTNGVRLPGTPISSVPYTITQPGHYYLTQDLAYSGSGNAIEIAGFTRFVSIDLGGFTLSGVNAGVGIKAIGPSAPAQFPLNIQNGYVRNFNVGIGLGLAAHARVNDVHVYSNTGNGIELGNHAVLTNCTSALNTGRGVAMLGAMAQVKNCMIVDNVLSGVSVNEFGNIVEESEILRNNTADSASHANVMLSTLAGGAGTVIRDNNLAALGHGPSLRLGAGVSGDIFMRNLICSAAIPPGTGVIAIENEAVASLC